MNVDFFLVAFNLGIILASVGIVIVVGIIAQLYYERPKK